MKQKKGKDYKPTRQWTNEDRIAKNQLTKNINKSEINGEFDEEKIDLKNRNEGEEK